MRRQCQLDVLPMVVLSTIVIIAGCGPSSVSIVPQGDGALLPAAVSKGCITPRTSPQIATLPSAGGVGGTASIGASTAASSSCVETTLATGSDATLGVAATASSDGSDASFRRRTLATTAPKAITQVELSNATTAEVSLTSISLQFPSSVPLGTYPATLTTSFEGSDGTDETSVITVKVTVAANGRAVISGFAVGQPLTIIDPGKQTLLSVFPSGTTLPTPAPSASPSASSSPVATTTPTVTPTSNPTQAPTATPTLEPTPTPTDSGSYVPTLTLSPSACVAFGYASTTQRYTATVSQPPPPGITLLYGWNGPTFGTFVVPPPTASRLYYTSIGDGSATYNTMGGNTATLTSDTLSPGSGSTGQVSVYLFYRDTDGNIGTIDAPNGSTVTASSTVVEGSFSCSQTSARRGAR